MRNRCLLGFLCVVGSLAPLHAQVPDTLKSTPDSLLTYADSLAIFRLIDSLMTLEEAQGSTLSFRIGYNSNILDAGRTLGISQFGLSPGITYYHKSGVYADITAYWSRDFEPNLYLTTMSVGYLHLFSDKISAMASFDHFFYNYEDDYYVPYSNSASVSGMVDFNPLSIRLDYSFYFGHAHANRIMPGINANLRKKDFLFFDRISFYPAVLVLFGDQQITKIEIVRPSSVQEALENILKFGSRFGYRVTERSVFGIMNYAFSAPLNLTLGNWMFNITYTYNIPHPVDNEPLALERSGYLSASILYNLNFASTPSPNHKITNHKSQITNH
jgi:hypothetical protein